MKMVLLVLFLLGLVLLHCEANARRFLLEVNTVKAGNQVASDAKPDDEPSKLGTDVKPVTASGPLVDAKSDNKTSSNSSTVNSNEDDKNDSYGTYGNPSGSSTKIHHYYIGDHPPAKGN
ncbi:uncharacterized protein LOC111277963 [Durio zibethinus]|uniref:Uncharacterized protein LOC111277963 n=1 Tax=Durio zibethinus TaxID=66656 RepID=A0A6P5WVG8_DURZI|nr:uncharacterized protein LOC111277963 [Durio zibethinus]